jgi:hypothetical protein
MRKPTIHGATRRGSDNPGPNEDHFRIFHAIDCAIALDGSARAGGVARRLADQFARLVRSAPLATLPDWTRMVRVLDSFAMGLARATFVGFRVVHADSGPAILGVTVGDAKLALFRGDSPVFVSDSTKRFLGTGDAEALCTLLRPERGDRLAAATDGAWNALGGASGLPRYLALEPAVALETPRVLLDDAALVTASL